MKPTIADWVLESVEKRKRAKEKIDNAIALSNDKNAHITHLNAYLTPYENTTRVRMIDEGAIPYDDGSIRIFIAKGTIQKYVDSLSSDYVGYINLGHIDLGTMPLLLGTWTKDDLHIVDNENGRKGLEVDLHFNDDLSIVQDLRKQGLPISYSVEMTEEIDLDLSETLDMPVVTDMFIYGLSVVGDPANVNSYGMKLSKGEENMGIKDLLNSISQTEEELQNEVEEKEVETLENEETEEVETLENETSEEVEETEEETEVEQLENEETISEDEAEKLTNYIEKLTARVEELQAENETLRSQLEEKTQEKEMLSNTVEKTIGKIEALMTDKKEKQQDEKMSNRPKADGWYYRG